MTALSSTTRSTRVLRKINRIARDIGKGKSYSFHQFLFATLDDLLGFQAIFSSLDDRLGSVATNRSCNLPFLSDTYSLNAVSLVAGSCVTFEYAVEKQIRRSNSTESPKSGLVDSSAMRSQLRE